MSAVRSPQARNRCACITWTTARECVQIRYQRLWSFGYDDPCECQCHEIDDTDNDDGEGYPADEESWP